MFRAKYVLCAYALIVLIGNSEALRCYVCRGTECSTPTQDDIQTCVRPPVDPGPDESVPDESGPDESGPDESGPDESGPDESGPDESVPDESGPDESVPDESGPDESGPVDPGPDESVPDESGPNESGPDESGPNESGPNESGPDESGPNESGPDETGPDETGPDETGPDETGPDETGPDETGPDETNPTDLNDPEARRVRRESKDVINSDNFENDQEESRYLRNELKSLNSPARVFLRNLKQYNDDEEGEEESDARCVSTSYTENEETIFVRGCVFVEGNDNTVCRELISGDGTDNFDGELLECEVCNTDACNSATRTVGAIILLLTGAFINL